MGVYQVILLVGVRFDQVILLVGVWLSFGPRGFAPVDVRLCGQLGHKKGEAACPLTAQPMELGSVAKSEAFEEHEVETEGEGYDDPE